MWVRVDDQLHSHPKVMQAWRACDASLGLHLLALSHAGCYMTDGHVGEAFVAMQIPKAAARTKALRALIEAGLWEPNGSGWVIHDYLEYNDTREAIMARRRADSNRKFNGKRVEA